VQTQQAAGKAWRAPGLDGVRALAVLAVLAFHEGLRWIPGGFLGVDVFFVLSGYLITDLLVARFRKDGKIGLGGFYQRRARRLLPALALMLVTVTAAVTVLEPDQRASLRAALLGAVTYTSNWWQAVAHQSYFSLYGPPPVLQHLWSLAVEEQFYLLWPLLLMAILLVARRRGARARFAWAGAAASALAMLALYRSGSDPSLVYYRTDTHASGLMIGAALALTWPLAEVAAAGRRARRALDLAGAAGIAILAWAVWHLSGANPWDYPFGLLLAALAAGALILAAAAPGWIGTVLGARPLRWLGIRSYGIYLWHWPVIAMTTGLAPRAATSAQARVIDALLPIAIAAVSWRWLEEPILRNGLRAELGRRGRLFLTLPRALALRTPPAASVPLLTAAAMLSVACTAGYGILHPRTGPTLQQQIARGARVSAATLPLPAGRPAGQPDRLWIVPGRMPFRKAVHRRIKPRKVKPPNVKPSNVKPPKPVRVTGTRVIAIGDSVMLASAPELAQALPGIFVNAKVSRGMTAGISIIDQLARAHKLRRVVIVGLGTNGPVTAGQIRQLRAALGHRWLLLVNTYVPRSWQHEVNITLATAAKRYPNVLLVNWFAAISHHQNLLWSDNIHPQPIGGRLYAKVVRAVVLSALHKRPRLHRPRRRHAPPPTGFLLRASYATLYS
jgi:peptidoglycan/LPS O-acetylase OafA/YrhL